MADQIMWAVKDEEGALAMYTLRRTRSASIKAYVRDDLYPQWRHCYGWGARCIRVCITEVQEEDSANG